MAKLPPAHAPKHGTGDRNDNEVARKDHEVHRERDRENRRSEEKRDRADESHTGNQEPPSVGAP